MKAGIVGVFALSSGIAGTYATQVVNTVIKPGKPVANFSVAAEGLTVSCQNQATGESGWWDFGDGTSLVPFSADETVTHTYTKPGSYTVKLTVRNFLRDENERSVPVEVATGPKELPAPLITGFAVTPVGIVVDGPGDLPRHGRRGQCRTLRLGLRRRPSRSGRWRQDRPHGHLRQARPVPALRRRA